MPNDRKLIWTNRHFQALPFYLPRQEPPNTLVYIYLLLIESSQKVYFFQIKYLILYHPVQLTSALNTNADNINIMFL